MVYAQRNGHFKDFKGVQVCSGENYSQLNWIANGRTMKNILLLTASSFSLAFFHLYNCS